MANIFEKILDQTASDMPTPPLLPAGTYLAAMEPGFTTRTAGEADVIDHTVRILQPMDDVNTSDYPGSVVGAKLKFSLWLTDPDVDPVRHAQDKDRFRTFYVDHLGLQGCDSVRHWLSETAGRQCLITVKHTPSKDGSRLYANIAATAKA